MPHQRVGNRIGWTTVLAKLCKLFLGLWVHQDRLGQLKELGKIFSVLVQ